MRISHEKWSHNKDTFLERLPLTFFVSNVNSHFDVIQFFWIYKI